MAKFVALFAALAINLGGVFVFRTPRAPEVSPFVSCVLFQLSMFLLLLYTGVYPKMFNRLPGCAQDFLEFWPGVLILELSVCDFWLPIEAATAVFLETMADLESDLLGKWGWSGGALQFLRWRGSAAAVSYLLSFYFLVSVMHATNLINLRIIGCGRSVFLAHLADGFRKIPRKILCSMGLVKKRVRFSKKNNYWEIQTEKNTKASSRRRRPKDDSLPIHRQNSNHQVTFESPTITDLYNNNNSYCESDEDLQLELASGS